MRKQTIVGLLALTAMSVHAEIERPPAGIDIAESRIVSVKTVVPSPCIAVSFTNATVILDKPVPAKDDVHSRLSATEEKEEEKQRIAQLNAWRGQKLLALLPSSPDKTGCFSVAGDKLDNDVVYFVMDALEHGSAAVKNRKTGKFAAYIFISYFGMRCGPSCGSGDIMAYLPEGCRPFLVVNWWVS